MLTRESAESLPRETACAALSLRLASASPRRALLLREHGFEHEAVPSPVDDTDLAPGCSTLTQWTAALAYLKARAALEAMREEERRRSVVVGADTTVIKAGRALGKPADEREAARTLRALSGGGHEVATGVCVLAPGRPRIIFADTARVRVGELPGALIDEYIASGGWRGKAGAYNLSERLAAGWPIEFEGDPGTIMGLPMRRLEPILRRAMGAGR